MNCADDKHIWKKSKWLARDGRQRFHCKKRGCDGFKFGPKVEAPVRATINLNDWVKSQRNKIGV